MMKHRTKTVLTYLIFLIILVSLFTGGCLKQSSGLSGENGTEKKEVNNNGSFPANKGSFPGDNGNSPTGHLKTEALNLSCLEAGNLSLAGNYRLEALDIELKAPQYELPLKESDLSNYEKFSNIFSTNKTALEKLEKNGFVVVSNPYNPKEQEITAIYEMLKGDDKPIFITSDTLLHLYHVQFDEMQSGMEMKKPGKLLLLRTSTLR